MRTRVYVDGFNLYYGSLKGTPYKWLNLVELARQLLPRGHSVDKLAYFTARVSGVSDPQAPARQQAYLSALGTLPEVEMHFGSFLSKTVWRPLTNLPVAGQPIHTPPPVTLAAGNPQVGGSATLPVNNYPAQPKGKKRRRKTTTPFPDAVIVEVHTMEEKGSDVNLAVRLLDDAWKGLFDAALLISNDTDLVTPIQIVTTERKKPVFVVCPGRWQMAPKLQAVASHVRHVRSAMLKSAQFPNPVPGTTISKPKGW
jgi:uncharacterized LabA/DUF88 family protein